MGGVLNLADVLARLDRSVNHEASATSGIAAGHLAGVSLQPMIELCGLLGDPQDAVPAVHVTGTNGKGSVAAMIEALFTASGLTAGCYSSPHLDRVNERIRRNGEPISDDDLAEVLDAVLDVAGMADLPSTWFELVTATAFRWFSEAAVDVSVVEVGLLGRYDATNVVRADVAVLTNIGLDHTDGQPGWDLRVTSEKAGIVTPGRDVICGPLEPQQRVLVEAEGPSRCIELGRELQVESVRTAVGGLMVNVVTPWARHDDVFVSLHGHHQASNVALAIAAVESFFDRPLASEVIEVALADLSIPGRVEVVRHDPLVVLDGAHNREAMAALADTLEREFMVVGSRVAVIGMLAGRDPREVLEPLVSVGFDLVVATTPPSPRGLPAAELAAAARALGLPVDAVDDPWQAVDRAVAHAAEEDLVVVAGSFYLVAPARSALKSATL